MQAVLHDDLYIHSDLFCFGKTGSVYVAQAGLKLTFPPPCLQSPVIKVSTTMLGSMNSY